MLRKFSDDFADLSMLFTLNSINARPNQHHLHYQRLLIILLLPSWICETYLWRPFITFVNVWNLFVSAFYYLHGYGKLICPGHLLPSWICGTYLCWPFITFMDIWNLSVSFFYYLHAYVKLICIGLLLPSWIC